MTRSASVGDFEGVAQDVWVIQGGLDSPGKIQESVPWAGDSDGTVGPEIGPFAAQAAYPNPGDQKIHRAIKSIMPASRTYAKKKGL